ncbi:unnamed protein product, partial [Prorocentrum cordatum]
AMSATGVEKQLGRKSTPGRARTVGYLVGRSRATVRGAESQNPVHLPDVPEDSEIEANWDMTPDPWHDTELQHVDYSEVEMSETEKELLAEGGFLFTPDQQAWRRWALKLLMILNYCVASRTTAYLAPLASLSTGKPDPELCHHPAEHRERRSNQYASWIRCRLCLSRISYHAKTKEEQIDAKVQRKVDQERKKWGKVSEQNTIKSKVKMQLEDEGLVETSEQDYPTMVDPRRQSRPLSIESKCPPWKAPPAGAPPARKTPAPAAVKGSPARSPLDQNSHASHSDTLTRLLQDQEANRQEIMEFMHAQRASQEATERSLQQTTENFNELMRMLKGTLGGGSSGSGQR